jgi:hypothetical protein
MSTAPLRRNFVFNLIYPMMRLVVAIVTVPFTCITSATPVTASFRLSGFFWGISAFLISVFRAHPPMLCRSCGTLPNRTARVCC